MVGPQLASLPVTDSVLGLYAELLVLSNLIKGIAHIYSQATVAFRWPEGAGRQNPEF